MKGGFIAVVAMALVGTACFGGGAETRTILVDHSSDEFASSVLANFPKQITVHQGDTLVIHQTWTGEPHTFTGGTVVNQRMEGAKYWLELFAGFEGLAGSGVGLPDPNDPRDATFADFAGAVLNAQPSENRQKLIEGYKGLRARGLKFPDLEHPPAEKFKVFSSYVDTESANMLEGLPQALGDNGVTQNGGQPCYLNAGLPPKDDNAPCAKANQTQPKFNGTQTFYSSGIIPYEGQQGNTYRVPLSDNIKPGKYVFFCAVHGPTQQTEIEVKPKGAAIPSQSEVTREAQMEIDVMAEPLRKQFRQATKEGRLTIPGPEGKQVTVSGPFAGLIGAGHTSVNEFVPKQITAKAGQPITWKMMGAEHTIAFDVPKYFPPVEFLADGNVRQNPKLKPPAGGAKKLDQQGEGVVKFDGGTYSGTGFWSSGLIGASPYLEYTMRIAKPGSYRVACLIHPAMVGTVVVTP